MDLEEQYDKIYRYCYFKVKHKELAEDITQEAFLKFLGSESYKESGKGLHYLYTIARNLCIDEYRKLEAEPHGDLEEIGEKVCTEGYEDEVVDKLLVNDLLKGLNEDDRELLLLRFVNEVPVAALCGIYKISRFALYRRLNKLLDMLREKLGKERN